MEDDTTLNDTMLHVARLKTGALMISVEPGLFGAFGQDAVDGEVCIIPNTVEGKAIAKMLASELMSWVDA
jgi:hypothetical protein